MPFGAWGGGKVFEATGHCDLVCYIDLARAAGAALVHLPIRENAPGRSAVPA